MARKKKQISTLRTPDHARECMKELKALTIQMQMIESDTNLAVLRIQEESRKRLDPLAQQRNALEHDLKLYVEENRHLFTRVRQIVTSFGKYGLRKLPPSVTTLKKVKLGDAISRVREVITSLRRHVQPGKNYSDAELQNMSTRLSIYEPFLKRKESLDKEQVLAAYREGRVTDAELADFGLSIINDAEEFTYSIDLEESES